MSNVNSSVPISQLLDAWIPSKFDYKQSNAPRFRWVLNKTLNNVYAQKRSDGIHKYENGNFKKALTRMVQQLEKATVPVFDDVAKEQERLKELKRLVDHKFTRFKDEHSVPIISAIYKFFFARKFKITKEAFDRVVAKKEEELKKVVNPPSPIPRFIPPPAHPTETVTDPNDPLNTSIISSIATEEQYQDAFPSLEDMLAAEETDKEHVRKSLWAYRVGITQPNDIDDRIKPFYELYDAQTLPRFILRPYELVRALLSKPNPEKIIPQLANAIIRYTTKKDLVERTKEQAKIEKVLDEWIKARNNYERKFSELFPERLTKPYTVRSETVNYAYYPWAFNVLSLYQDLLRGFSKYADAQLLSVDSLSKFTAASLQDSKSPWSHVAESFFNHGLKHELDLATEEKTYREWIIQTIRRRKIKLASSSSKIASFIINYTPDYLLKKGIKNYLLPKFGSLIEFNEKQIKWLEDEMKQYTEWKLNCESNIDFLTLNTHLDELYTQKKGYIEAECKKLNEENNVLKTVEGQAFNDADKKVWDELLIPLAHAIIDNHSISPYWNLVREYTHFLEKYENFLQNYDQNPNQTESQVQLEVDYKKVLEHFYKCMEQFIKECLQHPMEKEFLAETHHVLMTKAKFPESTKNYTQLIWDELTSRVLVKFWRLPEDFWQS